MARARDILPLQWAGTWFGIGVELINCFRGCEECAGKFEVLVTEEQMLLPIAWLVVGGGTFVGRLFLRLFRLRFACTTIGESSGIPSPSSFRMIKELTGF